jgi:hypothetical protein
MAHDLIHMIVTALLRRLQQDRIASVVLAYSDLLSLCTGRIRVGMAPTCGA